MEKKLLTLVLSICIIGLYTFGDAAAIFADTQGSVTVSKEASWNGGAANKDKGIAHVKLTVNTTDNVVVQQKKTRIVLVLDTSGSMRDSVNGNRKDLQMIEAAKKFVGGTAEYKDGVLNIENADVEVAIVSFGEYATTQTKFSESATVVSSAIDKCKGVLGTGTNTQAGIRKAETLMSGVTADNKYIVVLSDGDPTYSYKGNTAVDADNTLHYDSSVWPSRITSFDYTNRIGSGGDYNLNRESYTIGQDTYTAASLPEAGGDVDNYYYKYGNWYYPIEYSEPYYDEDGDYQEGFYYYYSEYYKITSNTQNIYKKTSAASISNNGYGTVGEAYLAKAAGSTLFSIGYDIDKTQHAKAVMKSIASSDDKAFTANSDLSSVFKTIENAVKTSAVGKGATITDVMGSNGTYQFKAIKNSVKTSVPDGVETTDPVYNDDTNTYSWNMSTGDLKAGTYTLEYDVDLNIEQLGGAKNDNALTNVLTNNSAKLTYTDSTGTLKTQEFSKPNPEVTHYTVKYYYSDDNGLHYTEDTSKEYSATAIVGCTDITDSATLAGSTTTLKENGSKTGYHYVKTVYGSKESNTALNIVKEKSSNVIKIYYKNPTKSDAFASPTISKTIDGDFSGTKSFDFTMTADSDNPTGGVSGLTSSASATVNTDNGKSATATSAFGSGEFTKAGTYVYTIKETSGNSKGFTYDKSEYRWTVTVSDNNGKLVASSTLKKIKDATGADVNSSADNAAFTNTYVPEKTGDVVSPNLSKTVNGDFPTTENYSFTITPKGTYTGVEGAFTNATINGTALSNDTHSKTVNGAFGSVKFTKAGTYVYTIKETPGSTVGFTYDKSVYEWTVTVTDNNGTLTSTTAMKQIKDSTGAEVSKDASTAAFTNNYQAGSTTYVVPTVTKVLTGETAPTTKAFTFSLTPSGSNHSGATLGATQVIINGAGTNSFGNITFTRAGTYKFYVAETKGNEAGYTYDGHVYVLTVVVSDHSGQLVVDSSTISKKDTTTSDDTTATSANSVTFSNAYVPTSAAKASPDLTKNVTGDFPTSENYTFTMTGANNNPAGGVTGLTSSATINGTSLVNGTNSRSQAFGSGTFTKAGTYVYTIKETAGNTAGFTYDKSEYVWTVTVTDNGGTLSAASTLSKSKNDKGQSVSTSASKAEFTNAYTPTSTTYTVPTVTKALTGQHAPTAKAFKFDLTPSTENHSGATLGATQVIINGAGTNSFGNITFARAGTYKFYVAEETGTDTGYSYDGHVYVLTVEVSDHSGRLVVDSSTIGVKDATASDNTATSADGITFSNSYTPEETPATASPDLSKAVTGDFPTSENYTFTMTGANNNPAGGVTGLTSSATINGTSLVNGTNSLSQAFGSGTFTKAGTYVYTIKETAGNTAGFTYDKSEYVWTVTVTDNGGTLSAASTLVQSKGKTGNNVSTSATKAAFTNEYMPAETTFAVPTVTKVLTGQTTPTNKTFTFNIAAASTNHEGATIPATPITIIGAGTENFGDITFTKAGTYKFYVTEAGGSDIGYTYDGSVYVLTVEVSDHSGALEVDSSTIQKKVNGTAADSTATTADNITFSNGYTPGSTTAASPGLSKTVTGDFPKSENYTFTMTANSGNPATVDGYSSSVTINGTDLDANGSKSLISAFGTGTFTEAGVYTFTIKETAGTKHGYTYDPKEYTYTVTVTDTDGHLSAVPALTIGNDNPTVAAFTNVYTPDPTNPKASPTLSKTVTGDFPTSENYTFTMTADTENPAGGETGFANSKVINGTDLENRTATVTNAFGNGTFSRAGVYKYTIKETAGSTKGFTYDTAEYTYTVTVTDTNGVLSATSTLKKGTASAEKAEFTNAYKPTEVAQTSPTLSKTVTGDFSTDENYTFTMTADNDNPTDGAVQTATSKTIEGTALSTGTKSIKDGFGEVTFKRAGTYNFTIKETAGNANGFTYDKSEYNWKVVVADDHGDLKAQSAVLKKTVDKTGTAIKDQTTAESAAFTNDYVPKATEAQASPNVVKNVVGEYDANETYTFTLTPGKDNKADGESGLKTTATISGKAIKDGSATAEKAFGEATFTRAGTYTYTIKETAGTNNKCKYDGTSYTWTVVVEDQNGELNVTSSTISGGNEVMDGNTASFTNYYPTTPTKTVVSGTSQTSVDGKEVKAGDELTYSITYKNTTGNKVTANITDAIPANSTFVSAENGGTYKDGNVTWTADVDNGDSITVSFKVKVTSNNGVAVENKASVNDGNNSYDTNTVKSTTPAYTNVSVSKVWDDNDNAAGYRPDSITVNLLSDGKVVESKTISASDKWSYTWKDMPMYNSDNQKINYTVTENAVTHYNTPSVATGTGDNGTFVTLTNSLDNQSGPKNKTVNKVWNDNDNSAGNRPSSVKVDLYADGVLTDTVTLNADNNWSYTWQNLKPANNGKEIEYTVSEETVAGYTATYSNDTFTITNTSINNNSNNNGGGTTDNPPDNNNSSKPNTGDDNNLVPWTILAIAGMGLAGVLEKLRREEQE